MSEAAEGPAVRDTDGPAIRAQMLVYLQAYQEAYGCMPPNEDLLRAIGRSKMVVHRHLQRLARAGHITIHPGRNAIALGVRPTPPNPRLPSPPDDLVRPGDPEFAARASRRLGQLVPDLDPTRLETIAAEVARVIVEGGTTA